VKKEYNLLKVEDTAHRPNDVIDETITEKVKKR
jgi:hypothetical protein